MKLTTLALRNRAIATLPVLIRAPGYAQNNFACDPNNRPAQASFDFTEDISRWDTQEPFELDSTHYKIRNISARCRASRSTPVAATTPSSSECVTRTLLAQLNAHRLSIAVTPTAIAKKLSFENPNLGSTHRLIKTKSEKSSDDLHYLADYSLPFYALNARQAWRFSFEATREINA